MQQKGYTLLLAGGCVRDALLATQPHDFDLVTDATPDQVESLFEKTIAVGKQFGVIRVVEDGLEFEIATFRKDGLYVDGRRPTGIEFSTPQQDAERRDFTINAMFYDMGSGKILDFVHGQSDLQKRLIRTVGPAEQRFSEDKLRILRALRFASQLGFEIEEQTFAAVKKMASQVVLVSRERIQQELTKFFQGPDAIRAGKLLSQTQIMVTLFPEIKKEEFIVVSSWTDQSALDRWFELFLLIYKQNDMATVEKCLEQNRFSKELKNIFLNGLQWWPIFQQPSQWRVGQMLDFLFHEGSSRGFIRCMLDYQGFERFRFEELWKNWLSYQGQKPVSLVKAKDLAPLTGAQLGQALKKSYWTQLENPQYDVSQILMTLQSERGES